MVVAQALVGTHIDERPLLKNNELVIKFSEKKYFFHK